MQAARVVDGELVITQVDVPEPGLEEALVQIRSPASATPISTSCAATGSARCPACRPRGDRHREALGPGAERSRPGRRPGDPRPRRNAAAATGAEPASTASAASPAIARTQGHHRHLQRVLLRLARVAREDARERSVTTRHRSPAAGSPPTAPSRSSRSITSCRAGRSRSSAPPAGSATMRSRSRRPSATRSSASTSAPERLDVRRIARAPIGPSTPTRRSRSSSASRRRRRRARLLGARWPGFDLGFKLLRRGGPLRRRRPSGDERGQHRAESLRVLHEGSDADLLGGRHRAGHARARRPGGGRPGQEPRRSRRRALGARRRSSTSSKPAPTSAARSSPTWRPDPRFPDRRAHCAGPPELLCDPGVRIDARDAVGRGVGL